MPRLSTYPGTRRTRDPEHTLELISPRLAQYDITRLADVTGLDVIGIPVVMSVRPLSQTLSVSQGKGATLTLAKVSAAMEAIELWYAENRVPTAEPAATPAAELPLRYPITELEQYESSLLTDHTRLDWVAGRYLDDGGAALIPRDAVQLGETVPHWRVDGLISSSNGLASGNTAAEAAVHGIYELIERDCTTKLTDVPAARRTIVNPESVTEPHCAELIDRVRRSGGWLEIVDASQPRWKPVECFSCYLWLPDTGLLTCGSGAHRDRGIALSRAITESVQSRLTVIAGTRDDLSPRAYRQGLHREPRKLGIEVGWPDSQPPDLGETDTDELDWLVHHLMAETGHPPMCVELTGPETSDFSVVKVVSPGLEFIARHELPRPE